MALLEMQNITFSYNGKPILKNIDFTLRPGELVSLTGPNGSGKSTLIKVAMGFLKPSTGEVKIEGKQIEHWKLKNLARRVAYLPQNPELPPTFTVQETVLMGRTPYLGFLGIPGEEDHALTEKILVQLDLSHLKERRIGEISGGERQRTLLARALVQEPECLLLDEPTTFLDLHHQIMLLDHIHRQATENGLSVLAVLHDLNLAATFTDRQVLLVEGEIAAQGPPMEVMKHSSIKEIFGDSILIISHPEDKNRPLVIPRKGGSEWGK